MAGCIKFLEGKLKLKVNLKKSTTGSPTELKFLGFSLYQSKQRNGIRVHEKPLGRFKEKLTEITSRSRSGSIEQILEELTRAIKGWLGYYRIAEMKSYLIDISQWLRRRIRQIYWKRWKLGRTRYENLIQLGATREYAWQWANSRKGYWRIAGSLILTTTMTNRYFERLGFPNILKWYEGLRKQTKQLELFHGNC